MGKTRNLTKLEIDSNGDVAAGSLDNVPPSDDASALTTGTLDIARIADGAVTAGKLASTLDLTGKTVTLPAGAGGKIVQIVRATDSTNRSSSSTGYIDANISVTITPTSSSNSVILIWAFSATVYVGSGGGAQGRFAITDSSNNIINGDSLFYLNGSSGTLIMTAGQTLIRYVSPATTSAVTYKGRFAFDFGSFTAINNSSYSQGQLFAIEVS